MILIKHFWCRLGNNIIELTNIINLALVNKHNIVFEVKHPLFDLNIITDYFSKYNNKEILTDNKAFFHILTETTQENNDITNKLIKDSFLIKDIKKLDENDLVVHIRSGDIFSLNSKKGWNPLYIPPPLSYYIKNINKHKHKYNKIIIVSEDLSNPIVSILQRIYHNAIHTNNSFDKDIRIILGATNIIYSVGTLIPSLMVLSDNVKNICGDMWATNTELTDYYKKMGPWCCSKQQLRLMLFYRIQK